MWVNWNHLREARKRKLGVTEVNISFFTLYWWHFKLAIKEFWFLLLVCIGSLIHAIFPFILDFALLEARIKRLKLLKKELPNDETLRKVHFDK